MRTMIISIALCLTQVLTYAQNEIGFKIGVNINSATINGLSESFTPEVNPTTGFSAGIYTSTTLSNELSFKPEINYSKKGFGLNASTSFDAFGLEIPIGAEAITTINTINAQLPLSYNLVHNDKVDFYVYGGPSIGYAIDAAIQTRANFIFDINIKKFDVNLSEGNNERFEIGALAGLGLGVKTNGGKLLLETEYQHGFNAMVKTPIVNVGAINKGLAFSIGYAFAI